VAARNLPNPLDETIRKHLKATAYGRQGALAAVIGRERSWLNRYASGTNQATLDDVILLLAAFVRDARGVGDTLTDRERLILKAFRGLANDDRRDDAIGVVESMSKRDRARPRESTAPSGSTPRAAARTTRGKPRASEE